MNQRLRQIGIALLTIAAACTSRAQQTNLKLHFDFSNVTGTQVTDAVTGIKGKLMNQATVTHMGDFSVLDLGSGTGYLDMTASAGQVVRELEDFTVSVCYRVDAEASLSGAGYFLWCFSQSAANTQTSAPYTAYRLNVQRMATSTGGWGSEVGMEMGTASDRGRWVHMLYRQTGQRGELFIDGRRVRQLATMPLLKSTFTAAPAYNWIGRPPFSGDNYLTRTLVADFRLYDAAVTDETVAALAALTADLDDAYVNGGGGDNTSLLSAIAEAESLLTNSQDYPQGAIASLTDMLTVARTISQKDCTQAIYDQYAADLRTAITAFRSAHGKVFDMGGVAEGYDTDRGFRHPGGMHTDADFARIRQLLADGNEKVTEAYNRLKASEYAQAAITTWPVETIVRGGGVGENYINAARGATMAYQNALRWKIDGTKSNAEGAVRILMQWVRTCKLVSGDSNWALAAGLYGYEFAQAAELMRDYEGWAPEDFDEFKRWMLTVWYPGNINFLRGRNGTWENYVGNQGGIRPGHYWSNWPLCNALAVMSIGILCDDVFIYNQGLSFMKYDQVGTFQDPRTADPILNDGCTEFMGNLVVTTAESTLETGAYGRLGQMQESGRDGGHAAMALGLAVDICKVAWNQGDDLFSYMDNRMAAGIEFVAACTQNVSGLPWTNYKYVDCRTAWHNGWLMTGPAEPAEVRPYWGTVIGHYEGVKGVKMPFAERAYQQMGIDAGGTGGTSGAYDHLGYSVLMNTYEPQLCPEERRPTLLTPRISYNGQTINHNELGGLKNTYVVEHSTTALPAGGSVTLMPQLPSDETDTGQWQWNTGETSKDITVGTDRSYVYRATYTNSRGISSEQVFTIAAEGDCTASPTRQSIYVGDTWMGESEATVFYGDKVTLNTGDAAGWYPQVTWDNGATGDQLTIGAVASERTVEAYVVNQGGRKEPVSFHLNVKYAEPRIIRNGQTLNNQTMLMASVGDAVTLQVYVPLAVGNVSYSWSNGSSRASVTIPSVQSSGVYTVDVTMAGRTETFCFEVFVRDKTAVLLEPGDYVVRHARSGLLLTANGLNQPVSFTEGDMLSPAANQVWTVDRTNARHAFTSTADGTGLATNGTTISVATKSFYIEAADGLARYVLHTGTGSTMKFWDVSTDGLLNIEDGTAPTDYPFELLPLDNLSAISSPQLTVGGDLKSPTTAYDLSGRPLVGTSRNHGRVSIQGGRVVLRH